METALADLGDGGRSPTTLTRLGHPGRTPMQNQNPYKPTPAANDLPGAPRLPRYRLSAFVMALFALPMLLYLPATIRYVLQSGDLRNTWMGLVFFLYLLSTAGLAVFVEVQGGARGMSFLPIALVPHIVLSLFILPNFFNTISSAYFSLSWIIQNPPVLLGWATCPIVWYYSIQCAMRRRAIRKQISGEPCDAHEAPHDDFANGNHIGGAR